MTDEFLQVDSLSKRFEDHQAVDSLAFDIERGSILALLGPSGSGKTTTLRLLAGFEFPDSGTILVDGRDVTRLKPAARRFGMVFQHYALFPHMTVAQNIGFGLSEMNSEDRRRRIGETLDLVDLAGFGDRPVTALSGGQQQRVAVARALAPRPAVILFDEPLSNLDPALREKTRIELRTALREVDITTVFVTHEQDEAFALGDVIAVLRSGRLEQIGSPVELYENPASLFVATFVGRGSRIDGRLTGDGKVRLSDGSTWACRATTKPGEADVNVVVRPETMSFVGDGGIGGVVESVRYTGARAFFLVNTAVGKLEVEAPARSAAPGERVAIALREPLVFDRDQT